MENNLFYVYVYLDPRKPGPFVYGNYAFTHEPFYIGKGKGRRIYQHLTESSLQGPNTHKNNKIKNILANNQKPIAIKINEKLTDEMACELEIKIIAVIGRRNTNTGPLTNNTNGGETTTGAIYSEKSRKLMSKQRKGKKQTPAQYAANCSRGPISEEHRRKISEAQKGIRRLSDVQYAEIAAKNRGRKRSEESRAAMSAQRKGKKQTPAQYAATLEKARIQRERRNFLPFEEYKSYVRSLNPSFHTARALGAFIQEHKPPRIPRNPNTTYRDEWISWNDLFGR